MTTYPPIVCNIYLEINAQPYLVGNMEERPIECTLCKRKTCITYKELKQGKAESCRMCSACPILQSKIGVPAEEQTFDPKNPIKCSHCQTTLNEVTIGGLLGCPTCYDVFEPFLTQQLHDTNATTVHVGSSPNFCKNENITIKIESLQLALSEALTSENYEKAALIRDQLKTLNEQWHGKAS